MIFEKFQLKIKEKLQKYPLIYRPVKSVHLKIYLTMDAIKERVFKQAKTLVIFLGYTRSGTSIIGFLLDAHPNIIISDEADTIRRSLYLRKEKVYSLILRNSRSNMSVRKWHDGKYAYSLPGQWAGRFEKLLVIGDKKSEQTYRFFLKNPANIDKIYDKFNNVNIKFIHVYRNPYDVIATKVKYGRHKQTLPERIDEYLETVGGIDIIKQKVGKENVFDIQLEKFIENPRATLKGLCEFLGVSAPTDYLDSCVKVVFKKPNITRYDLEWREPLIKKVKDKINKVEHLKRYSYTAI